MIVSYPKSHTPKTKNAIIIETWRMLAWLSRRRTGCLPRLSPLPPVNTRSEEVFVMLEFLVNVLCNRVLLLMSGQLQMSWNWWNRLTSALRHGGCLLAKSCLHVALTVFAFVTTPFESQKRRSCTLLEPSR